MLSAVVTELADAATIEQLRKNQLDAVNELKKKHVDEIKAFRDSLKGKPAKEIRQAMEAKRAEQKAAVKELMSANKAELEQFKKKHPKVMKAMKNPLKK